MKPKDVNQILNTNPDTKKSYRRLEKAFNSMLKNTFEWGFWDFDKRVKLTIVPDLSFNATAKKKFINEIQINIGVIPLLQALAINVAKLEYVWPDIAFDMKFDPDESVKNIYDIINAFYYEIDKYELDDSHITLLLDNEVLGSRSELSYSIYKFMWYFLIFHEYAHLQCKHYALLGSNHIRELNLDETNLSDIDSGEPTNSDMKRQWAELEADILGSLLLVEALKIETLPDIGNKDGSVEDGKIELLKSIFLSIGLIFLMFSYKSSSISNSRLKRHPHPGVRISNAFETIANYLDASKIMNLDTCQKAMEEVLAMLIPMGDELGIDVFRMLFDNLEQLKDEIKAIRESAGDEWINENNKKMAEILISLKSKMSMF
jgi:hypothetical protein